MSPSHRRASAGLALVAALAGCAVGPGQVLGLVTRSSHRELRERPPTAPTRPGARVLIIALDGVGRDTLASVLAAGRMPELTALLGGRAPDGSLPHTYAADDALSVLPSTTLAAWASVFTGRGVAQHGIAGNEFFVRERDAFVAPAAVSVPEMDQLTEVFTDDLLDPYLGAPTLYTRAFERDARTRSWVSMNYVFRGADRVLLATRRALLGAWLFPVRAAAGGHSLATEAYETLDEGAVSNVRQVLHRHRAPDVLTVYFGGADLWAHRTDRPTLEAQQDYLHDVVDESLGELRRALARQGALANRYVLVVADHGHTRVEPDRAHALMEPPRAVLTAAGFRVRPAHLEVAPRERDYQAVLAYQGAMAYVYLADRASCAGQGTRCDWTRPPRYDEDVLPVAEAFFAASARPRPAAGAERAGDDHEGVEAMAGTLDMVLTRRPRPWMQDDLPFEVYVGGGRTVPVEQWLRENPRPTYLALAERLRALSAGPRGERAGDVALIANSGNRDAPAERYYFASPANSWHGSPGEQDSRVPFVLGHPTQSREQLRARVRAVFDAAGGTPSHAAVTPLVLELLR